MHKLNNDIYKIMILGIISIIISGIALYSFRDIKFKNTKKLKENNIQQQESLQELEQKYTDLLDEKGINTNNNNINNISSQSTTGTLSILMPAFFFNSGFTNIEKELKLIDIDTQYHTIKNFSQYKQLIIKSGLDSYDIYLLPSTRLKGLALENINIGENPKPYFNSVFNELVTSSENKYIPYSIDPAITIIKPNINIGLNRENIFTYVTLRKQDKKYSMPLVRGIGKNDLRLLSIGKEPFENYFEILYQHIDQIKKSKNTKELRYMLDTEHIDLNYKYNFATFKQLTDTINKRDQNCKLFPALCIMSYKLGDIKFGFLSDLDILDYYFSGNENNFKIEKFPNSTQKYPVKGRIFVVAKNNKNINLVNKFFQEYLSQAINNNTGLRNNTLSAINNIYNLQNNQSDQTSYDKILQNQNNYSLIYQNINLQNEFINNTQTIEMLKGNYNPQIYLEQTN